MKKILVLEDDPLRIGSFTQRFQEMNWDCDFVDTAEACIEKLGSVEYDGIFLDHDLGGQVYVDMEDENTGSAVARWMSTHDHPNKDVTVIIHSFNAGGALFMESTIGLSARRIPNVWNREVFYLTFLAE